jgi:hypothetical protein
MFWGRWLGVTVSKFPVLYYPTFEPPVDWLRSYLLFFDEVRTIVPVDVKFNPSDNMSREVELMPEAFSTVAPEPNDILVDDVNLVRLEKAFREIAAREANSEHEEITIEVGEEGLQILGYVFLHHSKTSGRIRELLDEYKLARTEFADFYGKSGEYLVVKEAASNLLLSHIADKIGRRCALTTVTDQQVDFTLNAFNAMGVIRNEHAATKLASAIIKMEIPYEIFEDVEPQRYKEIRDLYSELREPFHNTLAKLTQLHRLDSISDPKVLEERVVKIATEFDAQIVKLKETEFGRKMKKWVPIGVGCALSVVGAAFHQPLIVASATAVSVGLKLYDGFTSQNAPNSEREHVQRLIGKMQENLFEASPFTIFA